MKLSEITAVDQFPEYYREHGLETTEEKIKHLMSVMTITGMRCESDSPEEQLVGLEDYAVGGIWRAYANRATY